MKITLVCHDIPYPPIHGGRIDMWRRIQAFAEFGVELQLICWSSQKLNQQQLQEIHSPVKSLCIIEYRRDVLTLIHRLFDLWRYPLEVSSRIIRFSELSQLLDRVTEFNPDLIWLDGIHGGEIALILSQKFSIPLITRCHNIEHLYLQRLKSSAVGITKIKKTLSANHLESYEKSILKKSALFYDISADDLKFWHNLGFANGRYLPPLIDIKNLENNLKVTPAQSPEYDIVFLGNLYSSNNVAGVDWLIRQVIPQVRDQYPNLRVLIAGANPVNSIQKLCLETAGVDLLINPESTQTVYQSGRILVNPVLTGSGVCIKSLEMLSAGKPIVSTPQGVTGLPASVKQYFHVAAGAEAFAGQIMTLFSNYCYPNIDIDLLHDQFGNKKIESILLDLQALISY